MSKRKPCYLRYRCVLRVTRAILVIILLVLTIVAKVKAL